MRADYWLFALLGITNATALHKRQDDGYGVDAGDYDSQDDSNGYDNNGYAAKSPAPYPAKPAYPTKDAYPSKPQPTKGYPSKEYQPTHYKSNNYPTQDNSYPSQDNNDQSDSYPAKAYPAKGYPTKNYPASAYPTKKGDYDEYDENRGSKQPWHPKTEHPEFFSLRVDDRCDGDEDAADCPFDSYAIRLENGIVIATPYNKWWDPKLPIFFVDDDTQLYTVSKQPLQLYIDTVTGSLRYAPVGWLPPDSVAYSFYKTGNNPLGKVDPSPASLSWPSTEGNTLYGAGPWSLCSLGNTGQFQVFVNADNYGGGLASGVWKDTAACKTESLAAINANPWKKGQEYPW